MTRSAPFAIFMRDDILTLALEMDRWYQGHINEFLHITRAQRTGCSMCGFGIHLKQRPNRFDRLREDSPAEWAYWMYHCCKDKRTGEEFGWGKVLDYIGVEWEDVPAVQT